jgi:hypothetical protein
LSELSGDLSTLEFSSYLGDTQLFTVTGLGIDPSGNVMIGGSTTYGNYWGGKAYANGLTLAAPAVFRIDAVVNAATMVDGPITGGETVVIEGAGFGSGAQVTIGGIAVAPQAVSSTAITVVVPQNVPTVAAEVQVQSGGASSNQVLVPVSGN